MIDIEKQSEEYKNKLAQGHYDYYLLDFAKMCFQDGVKCGMENSDEWHNLRENPNDSPKEKGYYWCYVDDGVFHTAYGVIYFEDGKWESEKWENKTIIIAWCKLPQFEKKRKCLEKK